MRQKIGFCLAALLIAALFMTSAAAESVTTDILHVVYTTVGKLDTDFGGGDIQSAASILQPGDDLTVELELRNDNTENIDWYMTNEVLYSLEDRSLTASGGAYTYLLTYTSAAGDTTILFASETVGGEYVIDGEQGLHEATHGLQDYFYLDSMRTGQKGTITLKVALDGETQGNDYQNTLADLQMSFAVEVGNPLPGESGSGSTAIEIVRTGDERALLPYYIAMVVSGTLLLIMAVDSIRHRKKEGRSR